MCFSATASLIAGTLITTIGITTLFSCRSRDYYALSMIPLFFGFQQFCEGAVWLGFNYELSSVFIYNAGYAFLFFAYGLWPLWIPFSLLSIEHSLIRKKILYFLLAVGCLVSLLLGFVLYQKGATPVLSEHHIVYQTGLSSQAYSYLLISLYILATTTPFLIMSENLFKLFGIFLIVSAYMSYFFWKNAFTSTWCFFAAILSICIYALVNVEKRK